MKNFAGISGCDQEIEEELRKAGIEVGSLEFLRTKGEVPTSIYGTLGQWSFERSWSYWVAEGPGIPPEQAMKLHATHGEVVRVDGDCGCPSPIERFKGFAVGCYHIDTQDGLNALAETISNIIAENS